MLKYLEGFFDCIGSPLSGSRVSLKDIYGDLLTSLYQLDDDGNKVIIDCSGENNNFVIDVNKPVYVGSLRDNSKSNFVTGGFGNSNLYDDITSLGFKPAIQNNAWGSSLLKSFIIDVDEDSVLPISYDENGDYYVFSDKVEALCLPKVNFYIYQKSNGEGGYIPEFTDGFGIKRVGFDKIGYFDSTYEFEETGAVDKFGNFISRAKASVLMLPTDNYDNKFELFGHSNGEPDSGFDAKIEEYSFDSPIGYGGEVDAKGRFGLAKIKFVNEDARYANLVPTDSCQFIGEIFDDDNRDEIMNTPTNVYLGNNWDTGVNDEVYCCLDSRLYLYYEQKEYTDIRVSSYIRNALTIGLYNTRHFGYEPMYLYNICSESLNNIYIRDNTLEIPVKRLPVVNLTGKLSKSRFDPNKPFIYIYITGGTGKGVFLCMYDDLDSDLIFQVAEHYMGLSSVIRFTIFCSATAPDEYFIKNINSVDDSQVYRLTCQPTEMNEDVLYDLRQL